MCKQWCRRNTGGARKTESENVQIEWHRRKSVLELIFGNDRMERTRKEQPRLAAQKSLKLWVQT